MSYNTPTQLELLFDTDLSDPRLQMLLDMANAMIAANLSGTSLGTDTLTSIEKWLAIHFAQVVDPIALRQKIGDSEVTNFALAVTTAWGKGLNQTFAGQQAISLDSTGRLASLGQKRASFKAARREDSDFYTAGLTKA